MNKFLTKIAGLFLGMAMAIGVGVAVGSNSGEATPVHAADDVVITFPSSPSKYTNSYTSSFTQTHSSIVFTFAGWNNGKEGDNWTSIRGGQSKNTWSGTVSSGKFSSSVASVDVTITQLTACDGSKLEVSTQSDFSTIAQTITKSASDMSVAKLTYTIPTPTANCYYRLTFNQKSNSNGSIRMSRIAFNYAATKTLSSIALSGTYPTSFTVGDDFSHEGMTVTATYSDSKTADVTGSATFTGYDMDTAGDQTVTVSYTEGSTTKTATYGINVAASTTPSLSFDINEFSGYTGQSISITATFANLESDLIWSASGTGSITGGNTTWSSDDHRNGTSTYTATLSGEGGKTITADADGVDAVNCVITITQTTVDITKSSTSIKQGGNETLAVSHNASSVGGLTWTSSDTSEKITVDSNGKVTVANDAIVGLEATITATSTVDGSVSDTCTVTVIAKPLETTYDFVTNFDTYANEWDNSYSSHTVYGKTDLGGDYDATITMPLAAAATQTITTMPVVADQASDDVIHISFELTESDYVLGDVSITFAQWGTKTPTMKLFKGTAATGDALDSGVIGTKNTISSSSVGGKTFVVAMNDSSTSRTQVGIQSIYISLVKENKLDHVTVSFDSDPADRTFVAGSNFAFNGTLTASYTVNDPKAVTPASYHLNSEGGPEITTSTVLNVSDHNAKSVYVLYTEGGITKSDSFTLIVNVAPATSVTLSANTGSVALEEIFEVSSITATVNPSAYATQGVTWEVYDSDGLVEDSTYVFDGAQFYATEPADVVFHVKATATPSVYAEFTLTISGDPMAHLKDDTDTDVTDGSTTVFADAGMLSYSVTTENFKGTMSYTWSSSNTSVIAIKEDADEMCDFEVKQAGSARLSCRVQGSTKGDITVYIDVTVTAVTVSSVTWTAPTINVYSGATLSSTSGWNVKYSTNSGKTDQTPESFKVMLDGSEISLPHTWVASDDGKALGVQVGGVDSSTTTVAVTQTINSVMKTETSAWNYTFGAKVWSATGNQTLSGHQWTMAGTGNGYWGYDATKGQQFGSGSAPYSALSLTCSDFDGTVDSVTVYTSGASSVNATVQVSVGGTAYGSAQKITASNASYTFDLGGKSGDVVISWSQKSSKAIYVKQIVVNTVSGTNDIANAIGHEAAQKLVVAFAKAFNTAMDGTANCTTGLSDAWSTCSSAWTTFTTEAAKLGETEEAYALNLVKYATAKWTEDTDENYEYCLERAMATYERCVKAHGQTAFMSAVRSTSGSIYVSPVSIISGENNEAILIIALISIITVTCAGGYFFLRKRKED